jgi:uncharacterized membrane protein YoaK (UPF0700 family)
VPRLGSGRTLLLAAVPLALGTALVWAGGASGSKDAFTALRFGVAAMLAFGSGLQNGTTSQNALGRTTHVTGDLTDMGIAMARADWWHVAFIFTKHTGFALGGVAGFMGVSYLAPATVLLAAVKAITLAALALLILDHLLVPRPARADPLELAET